jgi:hypothetical protein
LICADSEDFFTRFLTCDETWVEHDTPLDRLGARFWNLKGINVLRPSLAELHGRKSMVTVFFDTLGRGPRGQTINAEYYCSLLDRVHESLSRRRTGKLSKGIVLLHDNARPHATRLTRDKIAQLDLNCATALTILA